MAGASMAHRFPLHLISNQPSTKLHSQYDLGTYSQSTRIKGREPVRINPRDAAARGIENGDIVKLFNDRGECLAGAVISDAIRPGVLQISTGAWFDPEIPGQRSLEKHGNPNVLTADRGTSLLAQATTAHSCLVEVEKFTEPLPPRRVNRVADCSEIQKETDVARSVRSQERPRAHSGSSRCPFLMRRRCSVGRVTQLGRYLVSTQNDARCDARKDVRLQPLRGTGNTDRRNYVAGRIAIGAATPQTLSRHSPRLKL